MDRSRFPHNAGYRPDIDGLRALAVAGVVFYHLDLTSSIVPGGFTGVDVFFVISGYLITQILVRERDREGYLLNFAMRRVRRIFPALLVMIAVCLVAGYFLLIPTDYENLAVQSRFATFALSNFYFLFNTDYFDQAAELLPLLHTWSLAVEEQYYLVWPLVVLLGMRGGRRGMVGLTLIVLCASFIYSEWAARWDPKIAFYSPLSRAWELALGALLVFLPGFAWPRIGVLTLKIAGLSCICASYMLVRDTMPFPGVNALLACLGSALLLLPAASPTPVCRFLSTDPLRGLGLISYSLYLWHWPVFVFFDHVYNGAAAPWPVAVALVAAAVLLAYLSWRFVELPFRGVSMAPRTVVGWGLGAVCTVLFSALIITSVNGFDRRVPEGGRALLARHGVTQWHPAESFEVGLPYAVGFGEPWQPAARRVVIWGDSHAEHLAPIVERALRDARQPISVVLYPGCPAIVDGARISVPAKGERYNQWCAQRRTRLLDFLDAAENRPDLIVLAAAWFHLADVIAGPDETPGIERVRAELVATTDMLKPLSGSLAVIGQVPPWRADPVPCEVAAMTQIPRFNCDADNDGANPRYQRLNARLETLRGEGLQVILPADLMCDARGCITHAAGEFLYRDLDHLRRNLSQPALHELVRALGIDTLLNGLGEGLGEVSG